MSVLKIVGENVGDKLQLSKEFRVFLWKNEIVGIGQYWTEANQIKITLIEKENIIRLAKIVSKKIDVPFLVIDIAKKQNGEWIVIELNDAQESGYAGNNKLNLWQNILEIEKNK